jgi:hypothetical protein
MSRLIAHGLGAVLVAGTILGGCDKLPDKLGAELGLGGAQPSSTQRPSLEELRRIRYMSQEVRPGGLKVFDHLEQAKSCRDLELAMRWNRPPDVESGPFNQRMFYVSAEVPATLPKQSEVFFSGTIERGQALPSGAWGWSLKMKDGSEVQAIEPAEYWQKQGEAQQEGGAAAIVKPNKPGRKLCAHGIYQGLMGKSLKADLTVPLISVLFAMDRAK